MGYYLEAAKRITSQRDYENLIRQYNNEIQRLSDDLENAKRVVVERLKVVREWEEHNQYCIVGNAYKDGKKKGIIIILRYPDGSQRDIRFESEKIADVRHKIEELKSAHPVDWSKFNDAFS